MGKLVTKTKAMNEVLNDLAKAKQAVDDVKVALSNKESEVMMNIATGNVAEDVKLTNKGLRQAYTDTQTKEIRDNLQDKKSLVNQLNNEVEQFQNIIKAMKYEINLDVSQTDKLVSENELEAAKIKERSAKIIQKSIENRGNAK